MKHDLKGILYSARTKLLVLGTSVLVLAVAANGDTIRQINSGGSASSSYTADQYYSGGTSHSVTNTITTTGIMNPAPQAVYQNERYGNTTYTLTGFTSGTEYGVRLHFAELYQTAVNLRKFNVSINGTQVLSNYDIFAETGVRYKAAVKEYTATADASGRIVIVFTTVTDNATICGIEVLTLNEAPTITTQPVSQTITAGSSVTFTVAADGIPAPTYQWKKGGINISGETSASYTIASTQTTDAGSYTVTVTNSEGSITSNSATLTVNTLPTITTQPVSQTITAGSSVTFTVAADGIPAPTYQWKKGGINISGETSASYTIASAQATDAGSYTVTVTNIAGSVTSNSATLTVNLENTAPQFTTQPVSQIVTVGTPVTFTAAANGYPAPTYQWQKGGSNISDATGASYTIASTQSSHAGSYTVIATNLVTSVTSNTATLTVNSPPTVSTPANATPTAVTGTTTTLSVLGWDDDGEPNLTYTWTTTGTPPSAVSFGNGNGTNSGKNCVATFTLAGTYNFAVTIRDAQGLTVISNTPVVSVSQTLTTVAVTPTLASVTISTTQQFTASGLDQFGTAMGTQPTFSWTVSGGGTIDAGSGLFTAAASAGGPYTVTATGGGESGTAQVSVSLIQLTYVFPNVCDANQNMKVDGQIKCNSLLIYNWLFSQKGAPLPPDYVFDKDYKLPELSETEQFIKTNGHLPDVPSAEELETNGVDMIQLNFILLKKIEEMTLHLIAQEKEIDKLKQNRK